MPTPNTIRFLLGCLVICSSLGAQNSAVSSTRISTVPDGGRFYVDGLPYIAAQIFLWPQGSKHIVQFPNGPTLNGNAPGCQISQDFQFDYCFSTWSDSSGTLASTSPDLTVTASPAITWIQASLKVAYKVHLRFFDGPALPDSGCGAAPGNTPQDVIRPGLLYVGGVCLGSNADIWAAGAISLNAFPYPGFVFTGWSVNGQVIDANLTSYTVNGPSTIFAGFQSAKRVQFLTNPPGLKLLIDRTPTPTDYTESRDSLSAYYPPCQYTVNLPPMPPLTVPALCFGQFDFLPGSKHVIGAVTPQTDNNTGKYWVFDKFSNGAEANSLYTADSNTSMPDIVTANFTRAVQAAFLTSPPGLKLSIDGRDNWPNYNFMWGSNTKHAVTAPASQADANGRQWTFQGWSNDGPAAQTLAMDPGNLNVRLVATYTSLGQLKVLTNPPGIKLQIDGADCTTPCPLDRAAGTQVAIATPPSIPIDGSSRLDFLGWSDGAAASHSVTVTGDVQTVFANYGTSYKLLIAADPDAGADVRVDPPSPDMFYRTDTAVAITAVARPGFRFRRWGGDLAGVFNEGQLILSGPRNVIAVLDRIPYLAPAAVKNAAGDTPDGSVAPGSIISIYGESLAPRVEIGPTNPLSQAIADVVVTVTDRILPLLFVSPQQINAQVSSDLPDGEYSLTVRWTGKPDVSAKFTIARNAPGLFSRSADPQQPYALALHADGSAVTPDAPAQSGETVSVYGTGFGPYDRKIIDGFTLPDAPGPVLADPVEVTAGGRSIEPDWSGGAPGFVGMVVTRFRVPDSASSANVELRVKVNGKPSNMVLLPVQ